MNDKKDLAKKETNAFTLTADDVRKYFCPTATIKEVGLFLNIAKSCGLNPFLRELYLIKYGNSPAQIVTGYEVYLKRAERSNKYAGFKVWVEGKVPDMKACIEVYRKDWTKPLCHEVEYSEYVGKTKEGNVTRFWSTKPITMLKKVVISQAFRFTFPDELAGMPYTADEINTIDIEAIPAHPKAFVDEPKSKTSTKQNHEIERVEEADVNDTKPQEEIEFGGSPVPDTKQEPPVTNGYKEMLNKFQKAKEILGKEEYYTILENFGLKHANEIRALSQGNQILERMRKVVS